MSQLNAQARQELREAGVSLAAYVRYVGWSDGRWHGDICGCPDDRCIGYHHDETDDCDCLPAVLVARARDELSAAAAASTAPAPVGLSTGS